MSAASRHPLTDALDTTLQGISARKRSSLTLSDVDNLAFYAGTSQVLGDVFATALDQGRTSVDALSDIAWEFDVSVERAGILN